MTDLKKFTLKVDKGGNKVMDLKREKRSGGIDAVTVNMNPHLETALQNILNPFIKELYMHGTIANIKQLNKVI